MLTPILATKLYIPPPRLKVVSRPRLTERLNAGLHHKLTLISAPAGFGKTTVVSEWVACCPRPVAWLSLDEGDNDLARFLAYLVAALQTLPLNQTAGTTTQLGDRLLGLLQSPQLPPIELVMTALLNEIATVPDNFVLVLDDYHLLEAQAVDQALTFLLQHLPPQMHLVIVTREDPNLPLARLRARGQLTELRATDLRFTQAEAAAFLNQIMGLTLSTKDIAALETRTEGWIAGLQLAAISMQGHQDATDFIQSFSGSHHFVMDYLVEEVLHQQSERVQTFLLRTSILDRLCGSLCDAVLGDASASGQETLEYLEQVNLFIIPLDNERRWYRYHHLFADLLRQRLLHITSSTNSNDLHIRASQWFEDNDLDIEAFHHAAAANDIDRAERLMDGKGIPLHLRGAVTAIVEWLASLPQAVLNARPSLWWRYGAMQLVIGQTTGVAEKLDAAEKTLQTTNTSEAIDEPTRLLIGRIALARAVLALTQYRAETMIIQSHRALEYLPPQLLSQRANAYWTLGAAYFYQKERVPARQAFMEAISLSQASRDVFIIILATGSLGNVQEAENQLRLAAETYERVIQWAGDQPLQILNESHLGLGRIFYEWNDLAAAEHHAQKSLHLARQYDRLIDRFILCELLLARVKLAQGDIAAAAAILAQTEQSVREKKFVHRVAEVAAAQVVLLLRQGKLAAADHLAQTHHLPLSQAQVYLAQGDAAAALGLLEPLHQLASAKNWADEQLKVLVLEALAYQLQGAKEKALQRLGEALALAEPGGFIRLFVDEGAPMTNLLADAAAHGLLPDYARKLLAVLATERHKSHVPLSDQPLIEPLSGRELEVLRLIAEGLSNQEISERLFLALSTVKGHNRIIFDKLQVQRRTEAVARGRELGLL